MIVWSFLVVDDDDSAEKAAWGGLFSDPDDQMGLLKLSREVWEEPPETSRIS